jgi:hypothetical protein
LGGKGRVGGIAERDPREFEALALMVVCSRKEMRW